MNEPPDFWQEDGTVLKEVGQKFSDIISKAGL